MARAALPPVNKVKEESSFFFSISFSQITIVMLSVSDLKMLLASNRQAVACLSSTPSGGHQQQ